MMNGKNYKLMSIPTENILNNNLIELPYNNCGLMSIGMKAPDFTAVTTMGVITMSDFKGRWVVFFSHPGPFSPVCTTEYLSFANIYKSFEKRNAQVIALSTNSNLSHLAWVNEMYDEEGVVIPFPVIADIDGKIARQYGMISPFATEAIAARNVLIIDPNQIVRTVLIYPLVTGRNIPEILRILTSLQVSDEYNVVTPANWFPSQLVMVHAPQTYEQMLIRQEEAKNKTLFCKKWWWCYEQLPEESDS